MVSELRIRATANASWDANARVPDEGNQNRQYL